MIIVLYLRTCNTNIQALTGVLLVLLVGFHCMHKAKDKKWDAIVNSMVRLNTKIAKKEKEIQ